MMKLIKDIGLILLLSFLWFGTAYYAGEALITSWGLQCGLVSLITGLIGLAIINRTEEGRQLLYEIKELTRILAVSKLSSGWGSPYPLPSLLWERYGG